MKEKGIKEFYKEVIINLVDKIESEDILKTIYTFSSEFYDAKLRKGEKI